jgi:hypothetical protein
MLRSPVSWFVVGGVTAILVAAAVDRFALLLMR